MSDRTYRLEGVPVAYKNLGGRGLTSTIVTKEVPPMALAPQTVTLCPLHMLPF